MGAHHNAKSAARKTRHVPYIYTCMQPLVLHPMGRHPVRLHPVDLHPIGLHAVGRPPGWHDG